MLCPFSMMPGETNVKMTMARALEVPVCAFVHVCVCVQCCHVRYQYAEVWFYSSTAMLLSWGYSPASWCLDGCPREGSSVSGLGVTSHERASCKTTSIRRFVVGSS